MHRWSFSDDFRFCHLQVADLLRTEAPKRDWARMWLVPGPVPTVKPPHALLLCFLPGIVMRIKQNKTCKAMRTVPEAGIV